MDLADRHQEIEALQALLDRSRRGHGQIALLTGSVASGKTTLLNAFADTALATGAVVLTATASRAERTLQLGVLDQLCQTADFPAGVGLKVRRLLDEHSSATNGENGGESVPPPPPQVMRELSAALLGLAADQPVLLGVDDVQFADSQSLQVLLYLQRRMRSAAMLMVLTEWSQPRPRRLPLHTEIARLPYFSRLRLAPLSPGGVADVLAQHFDPPTVRQLAPADRRAHV